MLRARYLLTLLIITINFNRGLMSQRQISMSNIKFVINLINNNRIARKRFDLVYGQHDSLALY